MENRKKKYSVTYVETFDYGDGHTEVKTRPAEYTYAVSKAAARRNVSARTGRRERCEYLYGDGVYRASYSVVEVPA